MEVLAKAGWTIDGDIIREMRAPGNHFYYLNKQQVNEILAVQGLAKAIGTTPTGPIGCTAQTKCDECVKQNWDARRWPVEFNNDGGLKVGCLEFSADDVAAIRKWAES